jgi:hypothetical protein
MEEALDSRVLDLRVGETVEVCSENEILATLDQNGEFESLPFMPEMLQFCGRRFRVHKLAVKLCDTIDWTGIYQMEHAVHLEGVRCDGQAHGGCQAGCLTYWKEAWLKRVDGRATNPPAAGLPLTGPPDVGTLPRGAPGCTLAQLSLATRKGGGSTSPDDETFSCQATDLLRAAPTRIPAWDVRQYVRDVRSGNAGALTTIRGLFVGAFNEYQDFSRRLVPRKLRIRGGKRFPFIDGQLTRTPNETLALQPGELVRVKTKEEIFRTLDKDNKNRGMTFDVEMLKYCGRQARVLRRVERIIDEKTGKLTHLKNPCIILEGVICTADYHRNCPRGVYAYWREIWLSRVESPHP